VKNVAVMLFAFAIFLNLTGCASELKGEKEMKNIIEAMKELTDVKDSAKAMESLKKVMAAQAELVKLNLTPEEMAKLQEKFKSDLEKYSPANDPRIGQATGSPKKHENLTRTSRR
jgi:hypothetical protein